MLLALSNLAYKGICPLHILLYRYVFLTHSNNLRTDDLDC